MRPPENEAASFGMDITNLQSNPAYMMCQRLAGRGIVRVVGRCKDAQENNNLDRFDDDFPTAPTGAISTESGPYKYISGASLLDNCILANFHPNEFDENITLIPDLSECQLMQVPDAVYHLMRHTALKCCNLSSNVITKIPPKFAVKFSLITELNLAHNQMSKLPDELSDLEQLERLDISHNSFISLPNVVFKIPQLKTLNAQQNHILDVEVERILDAPSLTELDLQDNPLTKRCHDMLSGLTMLRIKLSPREKEDWEDLTI